MEDTYKNSGVDIEAGEETVKRIKKLVKTTFSKNVISDIGLFGGFFKLDKSKYKKPVLVSSVDGVGTKLKIAFMMDKHDTIGQDLVNHCVNDIAVCGAKPLFFLDYMAFGKLIPAKAAEIIKGFSIACKQNKCALIGGETAEMPGLYDENEYDLSGTIVGIVEQDKALNGKKIKKGDVLIGFPSNGLHTNGYSFARKVLFRAYNINHKFEELTNTLGEELLKIHISYLKLISRLIDSINVKGFSHITGGGIVGNTKRILPPKTVMKIDWNAWEIPPIFRIIQRTGYISDEEMRTAFNLGIGLIAAIPPKDVDKALRVSKSLKLPGTVIGEIK